MRIPAGHLAELAPLLDEVMDLPEGARERWLQDLSEPFAGAKEILRKMLKGDVSGDGGGEGVLDTLLKVALANNEAAPGDTGPFKPNAQIGNYRLERLLGSGGMGSVWLAEQIAPVRRFVALKLIRAGMVDESVIKRFHSERQSLAIMDHPFIAKVFDAGTTPQGQPYLVMEYVPGVPVTEYCDRHRLKIRDRIELFIRACEGVQHAHQKAIIHRDLKPANILVVEVDGKPVPRIIDFGVAKAAVPTLTGETLYTQFGQFIGTPGYMSPEQVDPNIQDIDTRSDVYSLGVILYVLLTGLQPFETERDRRKSVEEWLRQLREAEPPRLSTRVSADRKTANSRASSRGSDLKQLAQQLHGDLEWIAAMALERDRERRYGTPLELAADLRRYLNAEAVLARPASAGYQLRKFVRRHRIAAGFIGTVTVLAIVASIAAVIAVEQRRAAQQQADRALEAQAHLLIQAAAARMQNLSIAGASGIIVEVLKNPQFAQHRPPTAISLFQEIRAADLQLVVLSGHESEVNSAAYSPDGTRVVTSSNDGTARIWDARTGIEHVRLSGHSDRVGFASFSPDGTRIVTASDDRTARIWDARTGMQLVQLSGHGDVVSCAAFSPDGSRIITASEDHTARIWNARTGAQLAVLAGHGGYLYSASYSPDGERVVTASDDMTARTWDARSGKQLTVLAGHDGIVLSAAYSPDGTRIVTAADDRTARIWDARSGATLRVLTGHRNPVISAAFSPDGMKIVTASNDKTARVWDARSGKQLEMLSGHLGYVNSAAFSPDGTRIVTASVDMTARIWDAGANPQLPTFPGNGHLFESAVFSPDGSRILAASSDKTARVWDSRSGAQLAVLSGHDSYLYFATFSPDGARIVTASDDKTARVWDATTGAQLLVLSGHQDQVLTAMFSPDANRIVTASSDKTARIWDAHTGAQIAVLTGHRKLLTFAIYSPDGADIATSSSDRTVRIWDATAFSLRRVLSGHGASVRSAVYSPDGKRLVTASYDRTARIWDPQSGAEIAVLSGHNDFVHFAAFSPDATRIVTASYDNTVRIWDARTGAQLKLFNDYGGGVYTALYSPDGKRIVTADRDKTVRVWDAEVPASLAAQIDWMASGETDPLLGAERTLVGLPPNPRVRTWDAQGSVCDQAAAAIYDPDRLAPGASLTGIDVDIAKPACAAEIALAEHSARSDYQMGRALFAMGTVVEAKSEFELAISGGYRAARIDLAQLLVTAPTGKRDVERATVLYERAWKEGVPIAAFELGHLYEYGPHPEPTMAWFWYQRGADAGEPNALARFAKRAESAAMTESDAQKANADLLDAFRYYAAAADSAQDEDWPDEAWRHWRYRRATLARLLAHDGLMPQVAAAYAAVRAQPTRRPPTAWERLESKLHL